jgi:hypothetical protein
MSFSNFNVWWLGVLIWNPPGLGTFKAFVQVQNMFIVQMEE